MANRRALIIGVAAALVVLLLWWVLLWNPQRDKISEARDRRTAAEQQVAQLRVTLSRLQELSRTEALKRSQIEALRVAIPDQPNLGLFILDLNEAADRAGIDFLSVTPSPPTGGNGQATPSSMNLAISITGGYFQVLDFVNRLTDLPRIVVIDNLAVTAGEGTDLTVAITGRTFTTAVPGAVAPTTTAPGATTTTVAGSPTTAPAPTTTGAP